MSSNVITFSSSEVALKWQEPYVSQGLNRSAASTAFVGIHRGFKLKASGSAMAVTVEADPTWGDNAAVVRVSGGYALTVNKTGSFDISLSAYASKTVVIAIKASYSINSSTTAYVTVYEVSPSDEYSIAAEKPYLIVLGTVSVPASGVIASTSIHDYRRSEAWEVTAPAEVTPVQLITNSGFELSDTAKTQYSTWYWTRDSSSLATVSYWYIASTDPASGLMHLQMDYVAASGAVTSSISQPIMAKVTGGENLRLTIKVKALKVATSGSLQVRLHFLSETGGTAVGSPVTYTVPLTAVDSSYRTLSQALTVPAGGTGGASFLSHIEIRNASLTASTDGPLVRIDDVELWFDKRTARQQTNLDLVKSVFATSLALIPDPARGESLTFLSEVARSLHLRMDASTSEAVVNAERRDGGSTNYPLLNWKGRARVGAGIIGGILPLLAIPYDDVASGVAPITAIWEGYPADGSGVKSRLYIHQNGDLIFTTNAGATSSTTLTWSKDVSGKQAWKFTLGTTTTGVLPRLEYRDSASNTNWADTAWVLMWKPETTAPSPVKTSGFTVSTEYAFWPCNTTGGAFTATLPPPSDNSGRTIKFKDVAGKFGTNALTIARNGGEKIEGLTSNFICNADYQELALYCDGTDWWLV